MMPKALNSETIHSKTPSFHQGRKTRTKPRMHIPFVIGGKLTESSSNALHPSVHEDSDNLVETQNWPLSSKRKAPQSLFEGTMRRHVKTEPAEKKDMESDASKMEKTCHNLALDDNNSECNDVLYECQEHSVQSSSDAHKDGLNDKYGDAEANEKDKEEAILRGQWTHLLAWFAGPIIHVIRLQLKFLSHLCATLLLAWYHTFLFALNPIGYMLKGKARALEAHRKENNHMLVLGSRIKERVFSIRSSVIKGTRRLAFGCSTAFYTITILTLLFISSLMVGHLVVKGFIYEPIQLYEDLHFDYTKPLPVASIDFTFSKVYMDTGSVMGRIACPTRKFHATVFFTLPESDFNKELGIFQVTTELLSTTGQVLLSRTQPCMLQFRSTALQHAKSLLMAIPLLTGFYTETQTLAVSLLEWQEQRTLSFAEVKVMLAPRAGRPSAMGLPELYEAKIDVNSELPWWVLIIGHWRWTLSVWIGLALFIGVVVLLLCLCKQLLIPDVGRLFSFIADGLVHGKFLEGKTACPENGKLSNYSALQDTLVGSKHAEIKDSLYTCK